MLLKATTPFEFIHPDFCSTEDFLMEVKDIYAEGFSLFEELYAETQGNLTFDECGTSLFWFIEKFTYILQFFASDRAYCFNDIKHIVSREEIEEALMLQEIDAPCEYLNKFRYQEDLFKAIGEPIYQDVMRAIQMLRLHIYDLNNTETLYIPKGGIW